MQWHKKVNTPVAQGPDLGVAAIVAHIGQIIVSLGPTIDTVSGN